jgi:hypothetical protein
MALQVFTAGQTLTAAQMTTLQASTYNYPLSTISTSTYTVLSSDAGKLLLFTNNATPVGVTFPASLGMAVGDTVEIVYAGTGTLTLIADAGVTLNSEGSLLTLGTRYGRVSATKTASDVFLVSWMTAVTEAEIVNGSVTSAKLASAVAGNGLSGGAGTALAVNVDDSTIEINTDALRVKDAGITSAKLASAVAGNGLSGGAGTALAVNVDGSTLEISSDSLRIKDSGVTESKIDYTTVPKQTVSTSNPSGGKQHDIWIKVSA